MALSTTSVASRIDWFSIVTDTELLFPTVIETLAEKGDYRAMSIIGSMYAIGQGVAVDPEKAFFWLKEAAKHNRPDAEYRLGLLYDYGIGVKKNPRKAIRWYQKAVKHGYVPAQAMIGLKYAKGEGFKKDPIKAYAWLSLAAQYFTGNEPELDGVQNAVPIDDRRAIVEVFEYLDQRLTAEEKAAAASVAREIGAKSGITTPAAQAGGEGCYHGCQRWGEVCNVDPRGVYRCRRTCEKFCEICQ